MERIIHEGTGFVVKKPQEDIVPNGQMKKPVGSTIYYHPLDMKQRFEEIAKQFEAIIQMRER